MYGSRRGRARARVSHPRYIKWSEREGVEVVGKLGEGKETKEEESFYRPSLTNFLFVLRRGIRRDFNYRWCFMCGSMSALKIFSVVREFMRILFIYFTIFLFVSYKFLKAVRGEYKKIFMRISEMLYKIVKWRKRLHDILMNC